MSFPKVNSSIPWLITALFVGIFTLEFLTPPNYIFGYFYIGPILITNSRLGRKAAILATMIAVALTLLNLYIPGNEIIEPSTITSRILAAIALIVTTILSDRNRHYETAIAQQQAKLQSQVQLAQLREDFASTLTHDLKTPILGAIETLKAFQKEQFGAVQHSQKKVLDTLTRSHQTSLQLLETLLGVYRNDTEGLTLHLAPLDLIPLAEESASTLIDLAAARRVHIGFSYGASDFRRSLWVNGDALQLQRVFINLLVNAINHSRRGDRLEVMLESQPSYQVVRILDTGAGIQPDEFPRLFERFYQGHGDRQAKGSGLGLYLSRQIVEAHGGIIWAENRPSSPTGLPQGATFGFKLPVLLVTSSQRTLHESSSPSDFAH
jgi:two-component system, NarL family, sensor kinase